MQFPVLHTAIPGPKSLELSHELRLWENPNVTYIDPEGRFPVFWESALDCLVIDVDGNTYLDLTAAFGVASVGHTNPKVVEAITAQSQKLLHGMGDVHPSGVKVQLARKIAERTPGDLGFCLFGANGGDAVEAALKSAKLATGKPGVIAFHGGYHGLTYGALAVTAREDFRTPFEGQLSHFATHVPYGDLHAVEAALQTRDDIGSVIVEPIQGRGGIVVPPPGFLTDLRALCHRHDILLIADEIFTGWGRTGDWFACNAENVVPDILCIGKGMGGGFPISACVLRPHVARAWGESTGEALHTSTFLGNPLGCAAALAAIGELESRNLPERARTIGGYFKDRLTELATRFPKSIAEVRGRGLMLGLRFHEPDAPALMLSLLQHGLIVLPAGSGDVLEFVPPLTITTAQIDYAIKQIILTLIPARTCGASLLPPLSQAKERE